MTGFFFSTDTVGVTVTSRFVMLMPQRRRFIGASGGIFVDFLLHLCECMLCHDATIKPALCTFLLLFLWLFCVQLHISTLTFGFYHLWDYIKWSFVKEGKYIYLYLYIYTHTQHILQPVFMQDHRLDIFSRWCSFFATDVKSGISAPRRAPLRKQIEYFWHVGGRKKTQNRTSREWIIWFLPHPNEGKRQMWNCWV